MFWYLYLAHLVADYPLQPLWLVRAKRAWPGRIMHVTINLVAMLLVVGPGRVVLWPPLVVVAVAHFLLDSAKIDLARVRPRWVAVPYLLDQAAHMAVLVAVAIWVNSTVPPSELPAPAAWPLYYAGYILATLFWYVTERVLMHDDPSYCASIGITCWERMATRAALLTFALAVLGQLPGPRLVLAVIPLLGLLLTFRMSTLAHRWRALITDVAVVSAVVALIQAIA